MKHKRQSHLKSVAGCLKDLDQLRVHRLTVVLWLDNKAYK